MDKLDNGFKNYIIQSRLTPYIDFGSFIEDDKQANCQILVLKKPNELVMELMGLKWIFTSDKVILIYNCDTGETVFIPLDFSYLLPGAEYLEEFDLSYFHQIKRCGNQIVVIQNGYVGEKDKVNFLAVAIFNIAGKLLSFWKAEHRYDSPRVNFFKDLGSGRWLINFESKDHGKVLLLFTKGSYNEYNLHLRTTKTEETGFLIQSGSEKIRTWFSDEEVNPKFFVLVSSYQLCVYSLQKHSHLLVYERMANIVLPTHIEKFEVVPQKDSFLVNFEMNSSWSGDAKFSLTFKPDGNQNQ
jgi:hypothetical protein